MAKKFLSRKEYLDKQRQAIIEQSLENSNIRILPTVPYLPKYQNEQEWRNAITDAIKIRKDKLKEYTFDDLTNDKKIYEKEQYLNELKSLEQELSEGFKNELCAGASCIYTATDNYGKKYRVSGNQTFRENPSKYGFVEIGLNEIAPGDIIQDFKGIGIPVHAVTFVGYDNNNKALFNYSSGGSEARSLVKNGHYPFEWDDENPLVHLDGKNNDKLRHSAAAYRFIGTEDDNKLWNENYNKERSNWSKQIVEELKQVPTLTLPNRVQRMELGGMKQDKIFKLKGGVAIPLDNKNKLFYLSGNKHEQGGIDITPELEAEGGEVVKLNPKSIKVVTAQKIMGGKSPAELVVDASSTGKSEKVFNKVFNYQEDFKDRYNLNDDGTKAELGIIKKIKDSDIVKKVVNHLKYNTFFDENTYNANLQPMNDKIAKGDYELYPISEHLLYNKNKFYKKGDEIVYDDNLPTEKNSGYMKYKGYEPISYDEVRKMLPKRDYIGGSKRDVGIKVINKVPGLKDEILRLSKVYNISPDVFTQRLVNEGWVQDQAKFYNISSVENQKNYRWDRMNDFVDGYNTLGLDTFGDHHKAGHLNLRRDIKYDNHFTTNEDNSGRVYNSADFDNMYDALEAKAAMLEYLTKLGKEKGHTGTDLDYWVNAAYNMGEYHKDLNNMDYIKKQYSFKPYYRFGGNMKKQYKFGGNINIQLNKNKKKAFLGINDGKLPKVEVKPNLVSKAIQQNPNNNLSLLSEPTKTINTNKLGLNTFDWINAGVNTLGTLLNFGHALGNAKTPTLVYSDPIPYTASKLNTRININDAKNKIKRTTDEIIDSISKNTADSSVARNLIRKAKLNERDSLIDLYVTKENKEAELINKDILNQQSAKFKSIADYNATTKENAKNKYLAELQTQENVNDAISGLTQNLAGIATNIGNTLEQRNQFNKNLKVLGLTYPDLNVDKLNDVIYGNTTKSINSGLSKEERKTKKEREKILYNAKKNRIKMIRQGLIKPEDI